MVYIGYWYLFGSVFIAAYYSAYHNSTTQADSSQNQIFPERGCQQPSVYQVGQECHVFPKYRSQDHEIRGSPDIGIL